MTDADYWNKAALDPDVDVKYIADVGLSDCLQAIIPFISGDNILEIGSGVGRLTIEVAQYFRGADIVGIDISKNMIKIAEARARQARVKARIQFIEPQMIDVLKPETFDSAFSMLTFQHLNNFAVRNYLNVVNGLLKPGGVFRFQYVEGHYHAPQHHQYPAVTMKALLEERGFKLEKVETGLIHHQWTWMTARKVAA